MRPNGYLVCNACWCYVCNATRSRHINMPFNPFCHACNTLGTLLSLERQLLENQPLEAQRLERQRLEAQRLEAQRLEAQRLEVQRLEAQRMEAQRLEAQRLERQYEERHGRIMYAALCA